MIKAEKGIKRHLPSADETENKAAMTKGKPLVTEQLRASEEETARLR